MAWVAEQTFNKRFLGDSRAIRASSSTGPDPNPFSQGPVRLAAFPKRSNPREKTRATRGARLA